MRTSVIILAILCSCLGPGWAGRDAGRVKTANRLYEKGNFNEALEEYNQVLARRPGSPEVRFNTGAAAYKKGDYEDAEKTFGKIAASDSIPLKAESHFNIGNCKYRRGEPKEASDPAGAAALYRDALASYTQALEIDASDRDAKFNYEFVEKRLRELEKKMEQQEQKSKKPPEEQKPTESGKQGEEENEPQGEGKSEKREQQKESKPEKEEEEQPAAPARKGEKKEMSPEEARQLLESLKDEEITELQRSRVQAEEAEAYKDW